MMKTFKKAIVVASIIGAAALALPVNAAPDGFDTAVDKNGTIRLPDADYRALWQYLGSWSVLDEEKQSGAKEMHTVYTQPGVIEAYRKSGAFPDGAVLIKEVRETATEDLTTGTVSHVKALKGWFVMVKDQKERFKDNPLWGQGWGWAWFDADSPTKTKTKSFEDECMACHVPAKETDWIYTRGYPALEDK